MYFNCQVVAVIVVVVSVAEVVVVMVSLTVFTSSIHYIVNHVTAFASLLQ